MRVRRTELSRALERRAHVSPRRPGRLNVAGVSPTWKALLALGGLVLTALITLTLGCVFLCHRYHFQSEAMEPSVHRGQWIWTRPVGDVHRGEMVVLTPPPLLHPDVFDSVLPEPRLVLTRIVAVAGQTVSVVAGRLQIDGHPANEPYLRPGTTTPSFAPTKVPAGTVYVLGDHRENAAGSYTWGPVPLRQVKERLVWVGAPPMDLLASATVILTLAYIVLVNEALRHGPD